ncbi:MAG: hypothetical protein K2X27_03620 [Candidatus Obscuribacterales bacterium]|nr:hypothetical protein [Candidatus Obscuribacterales bacterium]
MTGLEPSSEENEALKPSPGEKQIDSYISASSPAESKEQLSQHHVSHLLSDVLEDTESKPPSRRGFHFPMIFDVLLALGLLLSVGGFTVGLFHMYVVHHASQSISQQKYHAAIQMLKGAPLPQVFARPGSETEELLSKARYLDAIEKLEVGKDIEAAVKELGEIRPGSKYFALAQEAINENTEPAPVLLQGAAETSESAAAPPKESLLEKTLKEDRQN